MRGSRRGECVGRGDRVLRRETGMGDGRACVRDGSGNGRRSAGFLTPLGPPKGGNHLSAVAGICRTLQRTARRRGGFVKVIGYGL